MTVELATDRQTQSMCAKAADQKRPLSPDAFRLRHRTGVRLLRTCDHFFRNFPPQPFICSDSSPRMGGMQG